MPALRTEPLHSTIYHLRAQHLPKVYQSHRAVSLSRSRRPAPGDSGRRGDAGVEDAAVDDLEVEQALELGLVAHELLVGLGQLLGLPVLGHVQPDRERPLLRRVHRPQVRPRRQVRHRAPRRLGQVVVPAQHDLQVAAVEGVGLLYELVYVAAGVG